MKLNLGCGDNRLPGWENHDADVDITRPLPWPDASVEFVFIEHCVEHVAYREAIAFFRECLRILRPGGVLRCTVPSIERIWRCDDAEYYKFSNKWGPTPDARGAMHAIIYAHGHQTVWTASLMAATLFYVGFDDVVQCKPGESVHDALRGVEGHHRVIGERFNNCESICFEVTKPGVVDRNLSADYDARFYQMHVPWKSEYERIADILNAKFSFQSVLDLGCGNGYIITRLEQHGKEVTGVDGSANVLRHRKDIVVADLTKPFNMLAHDLVICTEVAEHIEERYADILVEKICKTARHTVFFSAAKAGHGGHLHVNEQERGYWIEKFKARGFEVDDKMTEEIVTELRDNNKRTWWFANNCFVLRRVAVSESSILRRVAIVLGGSERVWDDVRRAEEFCSSNNLVPEFFATNDMIEQFDRPMVAVTLHPDKLEGWLSRRKGPTPSEIWCHDYGKSHYLMVTNRMRDWGGSVGLFAYQVARQHGHDRVILCGVPMSAEKHFVRQKNWHEVAAFTKSWGNHKSEMLPYVRSMSGGLTEQMFGEPTVKWIRGEDDVAA